MMTSEPNELGTYLDARSERWDTPELDDDDDPYLTMELIEEDGDDGEDGDDALSKGPEDDLSDDLLRAIDDLVQDVVAEGRRLHGTSGPPNLDALLREQDLAQKQRLLQLQDG